MSLHTGGLTIQSFGQFGGQVTGLALKHYSNTVRQAVNTATETKETYTLNTQADYCIIFGSGYMGDVTASGDKHGRVIMDSNEKEKVEIDVDHTSTAMKKAWSMCFIAAAGTDYTKGTNCTVELAVSSYTNGGTMRMSCSWILEIGG